MNLTLWILFLILPVTAESSARVRKVQPEIDQIVKIQTALGIATIIQVPDRPNSVVVGDAEAFKVEYLEQAITIKPLHGGARSNLYIYNEYRRFNVQLVTGPEASSDYVVYLENPKTPLKGKGSSTTWMKHSGRLQSESLSLETKRLGRTKGGVLLIEFVVRGQRREKLDPAWIWIVQGGINRPIHNLFLTGIEVQSDAPITGIMQVLMSDVDSDVPIRLELRKKKTSFLTLPKVSRWK